MDFSFHVAQPKLHSKIHSQHLDGLCNMHK